MNESLTILTLFSGKNVSPVAVFVRKVLLATIFTAMMGLLADTIFSLPGRLGMWFAGFCACSAWNFWGLAKFVQQAIPKGWSRGSGLRTFLLAQARLFLTGFLVYGALVWWNAPIAAILGGLSVSLLWAMVCGLLGPFSARS